jgi:Fe-Mn family superoxide dismutase
MKDSFFSEGLDEIETEQSQLSRRDFLKLASTGIGAMFLGASGLGTVANALSPVVENPNAKQTGTLKRNLDITPLRFEKLENGIEGLSAKQIQAHLKLYEGYVKKYQQIREKLQAFTPEQLQDANATYHPYRELLVEESFALNGVLLHEDYFKALTPNPAPMSAYCQKLLTQHFGSVETFKAQLIAAAKSMRGWAILGYNTRYKHLGFYGMDTHNTYSPMTVQPVLVIDVYEHAYMIDYGTDRASYLNTLWHQIDWTILEARLSFV